MKRILADPFAILTVGLIGFLGINLLLSLFGESPKAQLEAAEASYQAATEASVQNVRQEQFNRALNILMSLEDKYQPSMGTGKLYADIGTVLFQLKEYPMAILYYYRAKALRPRDENLAANLNAAQSKLQVNEPEELSPMHHLFFFHYYFSVPERLQLFTFLFACAIVCGSLGIWFPNYWLDKLSGLWLALSMIFLVSLGISYYFTDAYGLLLKPTLLYKGAGKQYTTLSSDPEKAGRRVIILESSLPNSWVKIQSSNGSIGYVPQEAIRAI